MPQKNILSACVIKHSSRFGVMRILGVSQEKNYVMCWSSAIPTLLYSALKIFNSETLGILLLTQSDGAEKPLTNLFINFTELRNRLFKPLVLDFIQTAEMR